MKTSNSPLAVLRTAWLIAADALAAYSHPNSPKIYTQHQLFAILALREFHRTTYRGVCGILKDSPALREVIGLRRTPHWTTLQKACERLLLSRHVRRLLSASLRRAVDKGQMRPRPQRIALDTSGFEATWTSRYYARRRKATQKGGEMAAVSLRRYPKLALAVDCQSHLVLAVQACQGPHPDFEHFAPLLRQSLSRVRPRAVLADAGFSSEANHRLAREELGVQSLMPSSNGRPSDKEPTGYYRCMMKRFLHLSSYGQRWQVETGISMIKRRLGEVVRATSYHRRRRLLLLKALTLNIMLIALPQLFY